MLPITKNMKGFTLVEMVVIIGILVILGTIGFTSLTGYFAWARDSNRLTDMNSIYGQLNAAYTNNGSYPIPDTARTIDMSGTIIAHQGYVGESVLEAIKFEKWGKDPTDTNYYTYTTNKKKSQAQLLGFFEDYDTSKLSFNTWSAMVYTANYGDYVDRKVGLIGNNICILLDSGSLVPVQETSTGSLDVANTSTGYTVFCDSNMVSNGTGEILSLTFEESSALCELQQNDINTLNSYGGWAYGTLSVRDANGTSITFPLTKNKWCNDVTMLSWFNGGTILPAIFKLNRLTDLSLIGNWLTTLPPEIGNLTNLTALHITQNWPLASLPSQMANLKNLTRLDLSWNWSTTLPPEIVSLKHLTELNLDTNSFTGLTTIIPILENLPNLTHLNLWSNGITTIPPEIGHLPNLANLNLERNGITTIPPEIGNLVNLTTLDVSRNSLTDLPDQLGNLVNLTSLKLYYNSFPVFPPEIGKLINLQYLDLYSANITTLLPWIGNLTNLTYLNIGRNTLYTLPPDIGKLTNLTELNVWDTALTTLPPQIGNLTKLTVLFAQDNSINTLPQEIGNLVNLTYLDLRSNYLTSLPVEMKNLTNLEGLALGGDNPSLWVFNVNFAKSSWSPSTIQRTNFPAPWQTMTIGENATNVVITVTP